MFPSTLPIACGPARAVARATPRREAALVFALPVEQAVAAMRRRPEGHLALAAMADTAGLSPDHFARVFREITGVSPARFRRALRMRRATELLLRTDLRVIDVCYEVGYGSLGSFTTAFTRLVGVSPGRLRRLPEEVGRAVAALPPTDRPSRAVGPGATVAGRIAGADPDARVFVGLFPVAASPGLPVVCGMLAAPGPFALGQPPAGAYHLQAVALPATDDPLALLLPGGSLRVGYAPERVRVRAGRVDGPTDVRLRSIRPAEPPILLALPSLLPGWLKMAHHAYR